MIQFQPKQILMPVDFSEVSLRAVKHAATIAKKTNSKLALLHVINAHYVAQNMFVPIVSIEPGVIEEKATAKLNELAAEIIRDYQIDVNCVVRTGSPNSVITDAAEELKASLVVMGTHGYGPLDSIVIGSVALRVLTNGNCPTMAIGAESSIHYKKVMIPMTASGNSRQKVNYAIQFAAAFGAELHVFGLINTEDSSEINAVELVIKQVKERAAEKGVKVTVGMITSYKNRAEATIAECNSSAADVLIIMTDQNAEFSSIYLGPYTQQILHHSKIPVIAIKPESIYDSSGASILAGTSGS
jgi:nucleotide-binding universal stress UspA family protein